MRPETRGRRRDRAYRPDGCDGRDRCDGHRRTGRDRAHGSHRRNRLERHGHRGRAVDNANSVTAVCAVGSHAVGGGGSAAGIQVTGGNASNLQATFPSDASGNPAATGTTNPRGWTSAFFQANANNTAWAICVPN